MKAARPVRRGDDGKGAASHLASVLPYFFVLSKRKSVCVRSHNWLVHLNPDVFDGKELAQVYLKNSDGFMVDFTLTESEDALNLDGEKFAVAVVKRCAKFYPISVCCDGVELPHESFLKNCVQTLEWNGVTLGITSTRNEYPEDKRRNINFHGLRIRWDSLKFVVCNNICWMVLADITSCHQLKMTLPRREAIVEDEFAQQLKLQAEKLLLSYLLSRDHDLGFEWFEKAQALGIEDIQESIAQLNAFVPQAADPGSYNDTFKVSVVDTSVVLVDIHNMDVCQQQLLWLALERSPIPPLGPYGHKRTLAIANPDYRGYSWYNRLPTLAITTEVTKDNHTFRLDEFAHYCNLESLQPHSIQADAIGMVLCYSTPTQRHLHSIPMPICFYTRKDQYSYGLNGTTIIVSSVELSQTDSKLFDLLVESFYDSEDDDFNSRDDFEVEASRRLSEAIGGEQAGAIAALEAMALNIHAVRLSSKLKLTMTISPLLEGEAEVSVVIDEGVVLPN